MALLIKNGNVVLEDGIQVTDLKIEDGVFTEIGPSMLAGSDDEVIDASGQYVLPGLIDAHVHYKMGLGNVYTIDNFETGSRAALFGGVTTVVDYADPLPGRTIAESLDYRIAEAAGASFVDYTIHMVATCDHCPAKEDLKALKDRGINSLKLFTIYDDKLPYAAIEEIIELCRDMDMVVTVHAEDEKIVFDKIAELKAAGKTAPRYHGKSRPAQAEVHATEKLIEMARRTGTHVHVVHVSSPETADRIQKARAEGVSITGETCPHYLLLDESRYERADAQLYIMQPPLRSKADTKALWKHVEAGTFSFFTTDHCAYCEGQKYNAETFFETNGGIPGTETLFPLLYTEGVGKGRLTFPELVRMLSVNPAKTFGLYPRKGAIRVGADADAVVFDPMRDVKLGRDVIHSAAQYTPFDGFNLKGWPRVTVLRGRVMCRDGKFVAGEPDGAFIPITG